MVEEEMLDCPFCGGRPQAEALSTIGLYWYECDTCGASSGSADDWQEAKDNWNKRTLTKLKNPVANL